VVGVVTRYVPVAAGDESGREIDAERCLGADEGGVEPVEGVAEDGDGVGVTEAGQRVAAPAGKVHRIEGDVGPIVDRFVGSRWAAWSKACKLAVRSPPPPASA
jgi:hypothetical protein